MLCDTRKLYDIQIPVLVHKVLLAHSHALPFTSRPRLPGCLTVTAGLGSCKQNRTSHKAEIIFFTGKMC